MLPFAKRGDDRSNNLVRLQQLFPRIVAADYEQPKRVSEDCRHLLKRMLTPDPAKRVTIPEIMQHPWCASALCVPRCHGARRLRMSSGLCRPKSLKAIPSVNVYKRVYSGA